MKKKIIKPIINVILFTLYKDTYSLLYIVSDTKQYTKTKLGRRETLLPKRLVGSSTAYRPEEESDASSPSKRRTRKFLKIRRNFKRSKQERKLLC